MAIIEVEKVYITFHKSEKSKILERLQDLSILHVSEMDQEVRETYDVFDKEEQELEHGLEQKLRQLEEIIKVLEEYITPPGFLESLFERKEPIEKKDLLKLVKQPDIEEKLTELQSHIHDRTYLDTRLKNLEAQEEFLKPWVELNLELKVLVTGYGRVKFLAGKIPIRQLEILAKEIPFEVVSDDGKFAYIIVACFEDCIDEVKRRLMELDFEQVEFHGYFRTPKEELELIKSEKRVLEREREYIDRYFKEHAKNIKLYRGLYDYYKGLLDRELIDAKGVETERATFLVGWVEKRNFKKLQAVINEFETASLMRVEPEEGEEPPIRLENKSIFTWPFETLVRLYGLPNIKELDPTPLIAPFFTIFFALCLTDAGYGIVLMLLSLWLMKKLKAGYDLFWTLFFGGFATIFAGAITGGWFGDIQNLWHGFNAFRSKFLLFDPMAEPMKFFALALGLGYFQIIVGLLVGFYKKLKNRELRSGIFNELMWVGILLTLPVGVYFKLKPFYYLAGVFAVLILLFSESGNNFIVNVLKGAYNLYGGIGLIGDLLSYVRLMALGIVTAGIAMAVNILTKLVFGIPILGYLLAPLIFIGGHAFSIFVNVMGAFVHSLRLQYVEFFNKFYENGGKPFKPFMWDGKYFRIITQEDER